MKKIIIAIMSLMLVIPASAQKNRSENKQKNKDMEEQRRPQRDFPYSMA